MKQHLGFQLSLSLKDRNILLPIIAKLQKDYVNSPPFEPHLSIYFPTWIVASEAISVIEEVARESKRFVVKKIGFGHQDKWSKILYVEIFKSEILSKLHEAIGRGLKSLDTRPFIPHISLMYKDELSVEDRSNIISNLDVPDEFTISGIEIVHPGSDDIEWRDYSKWKVIYHKDFKQTS